MSTSTTKKPRILVIEPNHNARDGIVLWLERSLKAQVVTHENPYEALRELQRRNHHDLVITEFFEEGMSFLGSFDAPAIVFTVMDEDDRPEILQEIEDAGATYLKKATTLDFLENLIREKLAQA